MQSDSPHRRQTTDQILPDWVFKRLGRSSHPHDRLTAAVIKNDRIFRAAFAGFRDQPGAVDFGQLHLEPPSRAGQVQLAAFKPHFSDPAIYELDRKITVPVIAILHQQDFQALESKWRGLLYLVSSVQPNATYMDSPR